MDVGNSQIEDLRPCPLSKILSGASTIVEMVEKKLLQGRSKHRTGLRKATLVSLRDQGVWRLSAWLVSMTPGEFHKS
jgi:hypothetical protein